MSHPRASSAKNKASHPLRIFLCHASEDKSIVKALYRRLLADGHKPWLDEVDLLPGQIWQQEIPDAIRTSDVILVCLSKNSTTKEGYIRDEIAYALDVAEQQPKGTIFLIPVRLDDCKVPTRLQRWQWVNLSSKSDYDRLKLALQKRARTIQKSTTSGITFLRWARDPIWQMIGVLIAIITLCWGVYAFYADPILALFASNISQSSTSTATLSATKSPTAIPSTPTPTPTTALPITETLTSTPTLSSTPTPTPIPANPQLMAVSAQVSVRSGPGIDYPVIAFLREDIFVSLVGQNANGSWWQIQLKDSTYGWVVGSDVEVVNVAEVPIATALPPPTPTPTNTSTLTPTPVTVLTCYPNCQRISIPKAQLSGAYLRDVDLRDANLRDVDLSGADLSGADLSGATLKDTKLIGADLSGANLSNAALYGTDLSGANVDSANFDGAIYTPETKWPENFNIENSGARPLPLI